MSIVIEPRGPERLFPYMVVIVSAFLMLAVYEFAQSSMNSLFISLSSIEQHTLPGYLQVLVNYNKQLILAAYLITGSIYLYNMHKLFTGYESRRYMALIRGSAIVAPAVVLVIGYFVLLSLSAPYLSKAIHEQEGLVCLSMTSTSPNRSQCDRI